MNAPAPDSEDCPVWARADAFAEAPAGWGWAEDHDKRHPCASLEDLLKAIRDDRDGRLALVWAPGHPRLILPEELEGTAEALRAARDRWTRDDVADAQHKLRWFGTIAIGFILWTFVAGFNGTYNGPSPTLAQKVTFAIHTVASSLNVGLALLMFLIFAFVPWYQARKRRLEFGKSAQGDALPDIPVLRFETWLVNQRTPVTRTIFGLVTLVAIVEIISHWRAHGLSFGMLLQHWDVTSAAGLLKNGYPRDQWWRLFTAPLLHGNLVHFLMNASALIYLGRRVETFARWPHVPLVFLFAATVGGEASARFVGAASVGASGGLMGWLGFLLVFETLHSRLVPRSARRRLLAGVFLTALIGLVGYRYIDNAAHIGGLLAGMLYAAIVFPSSSSPHRPRTTITDLIAGGAALAVLIGATLLAVTRIWPG